MDTFLFSEKNSHNETDEIILFKDPVTILSCEETRSINNTLELLDDYIKKGFYAAGFLSYETGLYFQEIDTPKKEAFPFILFGIFENFERISMDKVLFSFGEKENNTFSIFNSLYSASENEYTDSIEKIKTHLKDGNTYQVNYTFKYKFDFCGSPLAFFNELWHKQNVPYASFIDTEKWSILSLSPELFFNRSGSAITVKPMKGTIKRGKTLEEDAFNRNRLKNSLKNRAENIMIVDLLRNDLGRISKTGTVLPEELFRIEKYDTLYQMTSTIKAELKNNITWKEIFSNIFPSGSVTGAPKKRTMEIIREIEHEPRRIYTGSIGYITPENNAIFNVSIRTVLIEKATNKGEMGLGSGIIIDSEPRDEYKESILKGSFLTNESSGKFELIETILWESGDYFLLALHLNRLKRSAKYFSFKMIPEKIETALLEKSADFDVYKSYRVRLLLSKNGLFSITYDETSVNKKEILKIAVSDKKTDKNDVYLFHKTTNRALYNEEYEKYKNEGYFDVIFSNIENEITEGAISNIVILKNNEYFTPPLSSGVLDGVYRKFLFESKTLPLKEKVLYLEDLKNADKIFLINSVRKMAEVAL